MEFKIVVVIAVGLLGILSFSAGFGAEFTRAKASEIAKLSRYECEYPKTPALELGVTAAVSLLIAHIIINAATGCSCCTKAGRSITWQLRLFCIISWITFFIGARMLLAGAAINDGMVKGNNSSSAFGYLQCYYVKPGVFAAGAVLSAVSVMLGIYYFLNISNNFDNQNPIAPTYGHGVGNMIPMAQPQFPPQYNANKDPPFAHV